MLLGFKNRYLGYARYDRMGMDPRMREDDNKGRR